MQTLSCKKLKILQNCDSPKLFLKYVVKTRETTIPMPAAGAAWFGNFEYKLFGSWDIFHSPLGHLLDSTIGIEQAKK